FFFSSRRRHTRFSRDWSSDVCSSDLHSGRCRYFHWLHVPGALPGGRGGHHLPAASCPGRSRQRGNRENAQAAVRTFGSDPAARRGSVMKYISTRGGMTPQPFCDILLEGLAPDRGLAVPESIAQVSADTLEQWSSLGYAELAAEILSLFAADIPRDDLLQLTRAAYSRDVFPGEQMVPIKPLKGGMSLLGLSAGPTLAFKDMAMQFLGQVFEYVLQRRGATLNILGATSGDTGSAAEYAMRGKRGVNVFMLPPQGRMSAFQRAQMYSLQDENIHNI